MTEATMNDHTRQFYLLEIPTAIGGPRRFSLFDAVADVEIEMREVEAIGSSPVKPKSLSPPAARP
jgi:hypothetical protein